MSESGSHGGLDRRWRCCVLRSASLRHSGPRLRSPAFLFGDKRAISILDLGFEASSVRGTYRHPGTPLTLEFLDGPLAVGGEVVSTWGFGSTLRAKVLHIITPTDCVRDRLAAGIHCGTTLTQRAKEREVAKLRSRSISS